MLLAVENLRKTYHTSEESIAILKGISLTLGAGETLALTGESGCGKSTLLHLIGGLDTIEDGSVQINGAELSGMSDTERAALRCGTVGVIFQQFNLVPSLSVADNIALQAKLANTYDADWIDHLVMGLKLSDQRTKYPEHLSGGQQQRVAIARTLAAKPQLVLADEPTGNLDQASSDTVMDMFLSLVQDAQTSVLMVTHSIATADKLDQRLHLSDGRVQST